MKHFAALFDGLDKMRLGDGIGAAAAPAATAGPALPAQDRSWIAGRSERWGGAGEGEPTARVGGGGFASWEGRGAAAAGARCISPVRLRSARRASFEDAGAGAAGAQGTEAAAAEAAAPAAVAAAASFNEGALDDDEYEEDEEEALIADEELGVVSAAWAGSFRSCMKWQGETRPDLVQPCGNATFPPRLPASPWGPACLRTTLTNYTVMAKRSAASLVSRNPLPRNPHTGSCRNATCWARAPGRLLRPTVPILCRLCATPHPPPHRFLLKRCLRDWGPGPPLPTACFATKRTIYSLFHDVHNPHLIPSPGPCRDAASGSRPPGHLLRPPVCQAGARHEAERGAEEEEGGHTGGLQFVPGQHRDSGIWVTRMKGRWREP